MPTNLFQLGSFVAASGRILPYKIECDCLTDADWQCLAWMIAQRVTFGVIEGVPRGGLKLAAALEKYKSASGPLLLVDDVGTSGGSLNRQRAGRDAIGYVVFQRGTLPEWVGSLFRLSD